MELIGYLIHSGQLFPAAQGNLAAQNGGKSEIVANTTFFGCTGHPGRIIWEEIRNCSKDDFLKVNGTHWLPDPLRSAFSSCTGQPGCTKWREIRNCSKYDFFWLHRAPRLHNMGGNRKL